MGKFKLLFQLVIISACTALPIQAQAADNFEVLDIKLEPSQRDWQRFHRLGAKQRAKFWRYYEKQGNKFSSWSWGWRLGWVRACGSSRAKYCRDIVSQGLFDKALVVRAEAATRLGDRYAGTGNTSVIRLLAKAYANKRNSRNGRPMFVQERILHAISKIGGKQAKATGTELARRHPDSTSYWQKVSRVL